MNPTRIILIILALAAAGTTPAQEFSNYRVVSQRNIFNQNRVPQSRGTAPVVVRTVPRGTVDSLSLVGTLVYEKGRFAFFDGTSPDYRQVVQPAGTIAGYKVTAILPHSVQLEAGGKQFEMQVGTQLRRHGDIAQLAGGTVISTNATPVATTFATPTSTAAPAAAATPSAADAADVLKKLMEKRAQELK